MKIRDILLGLTFALIWSSAFTSARISMMDAPPFLLLSLRFFLSGTLAIAIAKFLGQKIQFSNADWLSIFIFGICQNTIYLGLNFVAMQSIDASVAAIIASMLPIVVTIFSWIFFKEKLSLLGILGLTLGILGIIIIMQTNLTSKLDSNGVVLCLFGVLALSIATIVIQKSSGQNILMMVGLQMLVGSFTLFPLSLALETWQISWTYSLIASFLYTTIFPGIVATLIWFKLLHFIGPIKAASFHFLNPFFGVLIANLILSEQLLLQQIFGVILVMVAILILQISNITKKRT